MKTIKLLDLCCKAGGGAAGYEQAAKDLGVKIQITGIDIEPQKNYPFKFIQADAVEFLKKHHSKFTHIHASPPCQKYTPSTSQYKKQGKVYKDNLSDLRALMYETGLPGVIENVMQAPLRPDIILRGDMFGLGVIRKRKFEIVNWFALQPLPAKLNGSVKEGDFVSVFGKGSWQTNKGGNKRPKFEKSTIRETWAYAMGVTHKMLDIELSEAIPPAYTRYIGVEFFKQIL